MLLVILSLTQIPRSLQTLQLRLRIQHLHHAYEIPTTHNVPVEGMCRRTIEDDSEGVKNYRWSRHRRMPSLSHASLVTHHEVGYTACVSSNGRETYRDAGAIASPAQWNSICKCVYVPLAYLTWHCHLQTHLVSLFANSVLIKICNIPTSFSRQTAPGGFAFHLYVLYSARCLESRVGNLDTYFATIV